jgi:hypothetical protein
MRIDSSLLAQHMRAELETCDDPARRERLRAYLGLLDDARAKRQAARDEAERRALGRWRGEVEARRRGRR